MAGELGRFWTDYTWDVGSGLPVVLQETYREKTKMAQETRYVKTYVYGLDLISVYTDDLEHGTAAQDYYFADGLGSTVTLARDSEPSETTTWTYDAFGEVRTQSRTLSTDFLFTGEQFDAKARVPQGGKDVGLYYLRARYYDPSTGRFLSRDPFSGWTTAPQSQNRYVYVVNNPIRFIDPLGLHCSPAPWDWDDCEDDAEEWVEDNVVEPVAAATADFLSDPENVASAVQLVSGAVATTVCTKPLGTPGLVVCGVSLAVYGGASIAQFALADSAHEQVIVGITAPVGILPIKTQPWNFLLAWTTGSLDALSSPLPVYGLTTGADRVPWPAAVRHPTTAKE